MANLSTYAGKLLLDFMMNATTATRPTNWYVNLSLGSPTNAAASEIATGSGITRQTLAMPAASTAAATNSSGTQVNTASLSFGPINAAGTITGLDIWGGTVATDAGTSGAGQHLWFGTLATVRALASGDSLIISSAALTALMG